LYIRRGDKSRAALLGGAVNFKQKSKARIKAASLVNLAQDARSNGRQKLKANLKSRVKFWRLDSLLSLT